MRNSSTKSLADRAQKGLGAGCLRLFFLPFFLVGAGLFYGFTIRPVLQVLAARDWQKTPCVIESSEVASHRGDDSTTYSIEIAYRYFFAGQDYTSKRYHFSTVSSSGRKSKSAVVNRYPPGTETVCYVNPQAPHEAVLDRGLQPVYAFGGLGLVFALAGGLGLVFAPRLARSGRSADSADLLATPQAAASTTGGPAVLKPKYSPLAKFLGMLAFFVIWNAFIGVFVFFLFFDEDASRAPLFPKIIVGLLALVGVGTIFGVLYNLLALFNPRVRLSAPTTVVPLGGQLNFTWTISGRAGMLRKLRIVFEGREEATYKRGTSTSTDTSVFAEIPVFESAEREFLSQGGGRVAVPANLMHTFEAGHNKVLWRLKVHGEISRWPDVSDEYPITVLPLASRS